MKTGDKVKLSGRFIQSIGLAFHEGVYTELHQHGIIQGVKKVGPCFLASITWDDGSTTKANIKNLQTI